MIHDDTAWNKPGTSASTDRRADDRVPCPAEVLIAWLHDPETRIRYRLCDVSDGGCRIKTRSPLIEGMTCVVLKLLPTGEGIHRAASVSWVRIDEANGEREAGLHFIT